MLLRIMAPMTPPFSFVAYRAIMHPTIGEREGSASPHRQLIGGRGRPPLEGAEPLGELRVGERRLGGVRL